MIRLAAVPLAAAALFALSLALFWPGVAEYDTVAQFAQVLSGHYDDWHPPVMARLWAVLHAGFGGGTGPMLVAQLALYWAGLGLLGDALAAVGRRISGWAVLAIGAFPPLLSWAAVVLKDGQMLAALLFVVGLVAHWRLRGRRLPVWAVALACVLLGYATLVRSNAVFATIPLAVLLAGGAWRPRTRWVAAAIGTLLVLAAMPVINHDLFGASPSHASRSQPVFDLAAIAARGGGGPLATEGPALRANRCYSILFWDPLAGVPACATLVRPLDYPTVRDLYAAWGATVVGDPWRYAEHRLTHFNSTERWLVAFEWPAGAARATDEPNSIGLTGPGPGALMWQRLAALLVELPLAWPIVHVVAAIGAVLLARRRPAGGARDLALALAGSALVLELSFLVVSVASDLRYHLWPMTATALAWVLLDVSSMSRRQGVALGLVLAAMITGGSVSRALRPIPPQDYAEQLHWPTFVAAR